MTTNERVAWVTGASRGVGHGIAVALGRAGWTVWVTGRTTEAGGGPPNAPGTVERTARSVDEAGGTGVPAVCDHTDDDAVRAVVDRIRDTHGRLDLLVNNVWGGYERLNAGAWDEWNAPLWEQPLELVDLMLGAGVRAHYTSLALAAPLLIASPRGLVVTVSFDVDESGGEPFGAAYSLAKVADDRLAAVAARQLRRHGVTSVALHPGLVRTEGVLRFADYLDLRESQSPEGVGRAVVALADDPEVLAVTGRTLAVDDLAWRYGIDVRAR
jgi:NAD(P)-dependent dehydrogenase (short-subunit alcohol dehydrogenase family)